MLQKNYSKAVVGRSYLSFIYGIELLRHKHSVLLLDDERLQFGDLFNHGITSLDIEFFKVWGADRDIICLQNIENFLSQKPLYFNWGQKRVRLGDGVWSNLRELYRKFPQFFPFESFFYGDDPSIKENFEKDYNLLTKRLGTNGFRFKTLENTTIEFLLGQSPQNIKDAFLLFKKGIKDNKKQAWRFLYFARAIYHKRLASSHSEVELFHFFISLLSPHYLLEDQLLIKELAEVFIEKGGHFKETQVREWKFYKGMPWSMELASFEGIIHPQKIAFLGSWPLGLPLKVKHGWQRFQSIHFEADYTDHRLKGRVGDWVIWSSPDYLATDLPMWRLEIMDGVIRGQFLYREKLGSKLTFYKELLNRLLFKGLEEWLPGVTNSLVNLKYHPGREVYLDQSNFFKSPPLPRLREVKLYDFSSPFLKNKLKNVSYFGPLKGCPLGLYGQLLELKEVSKYQ
ncbi:MAG: hypothetical protein K9K67_13180 [Bacteriovoracaceae bacterium]|nr:hypothetical protein [Bacteriovoracaceae bacterium]